MYVSSYCGYCSNDGNDIRILVIEGNKITCTNCGKKTIMKKAVKGLPNKCLERQDEYD